MYKGMYVINYYVFTITICIVLFGRVVAPKSECRTKDLEFDFRVG